MSGPRVFADHHHHALYQSLRLFFEDRMGGELYRPTGMEWYDAELWNYERAQWGDGVARQYLAPWPDDVDKGDHIERVDRQNPGRVHKMVTLEQFRDQRWDMVMATLDHNEPAYAGLAKEKHARYAIEIGNQWGDHRWDLDPLTFVAIHPNPAPDTVTSVNLRQEFSLADFRYERPTSFGPIRSFMNCFPETQDYREHFLPVAKEAPDFHWEVMGAYGSAPLDEYEGRNIEATPDVAAAMRESGIIWHSKHWSDGFGHVIHNAFAVGRPVIGFQRYYADKLAGPLWVDGVTSLDLERLGTQNAVTALRELRDEPDRYLAMCDAAAARFREVVNFDAEAEIAMRVVEQELGVAA